MLGIRDAAIAAVTNLYREIFPGGGAILDLMSGWVSHLPPKSRMRALLVSASALANWRRTLFSTSGAYRI